MVEEYKRIDAEARQAGQDIVAAEGRAQAAMQGAVSAATPGGGLPLGWQESRDPSTGQTYYVNASSGVTAWERPKMLQPGWEQCADDSGKPYFYNAASGETRWEAPEAAGGGGGGGAGDIRSAMAEVGSAKERQINLGRELEQVTAQVQQARETARVAAAKAAESERSAAEARAAAGDVKIAKGVNWQTKAAEAEEAYAQAYKANQASQTAEQSAQQSAAQLAQADAALQQALEAEKAAEAAAKEAAQAKPKLLAPGWERSVERGTGRPYFVNDTTKQTVWEAPLIEAPSPAEATREEASTGQARVAKEQRFAEASRVAEAARAETAERQAEDARLEQVAQQAATAATAWEERVQQSEGNAAAAKAAAETAAQQETDSKQAAKDAKQKAPRPPKGGAGGGALPPGWSQAADPQGRPYYINSATNETSWERPAAPAVRKLSKPPKDETEEERTARELENATKPLEAAQAKQAEKRQQLAECLQAIEALRKEEMRINGELNSHGQKVAVTQQRVAQATQASQAADAGLVPKYTQLLEAVTEAERLSAAKGRAAREHRQAEAQFYEKMAAEARQAVDLVVVEEERALAQWMAEVTADTYFAAPAPRPPAARGPPPALPAPQGAPPPGAPPPGAPPPGRRGPNVPTRMAITGGGFMGGRFFGK